jgi:hypothetical protein
MDSIFSLFGSRKNGRKEVGMRNLHLGPKLFHPLNYEKIMEGKQQSNKGDVFLQFYKRGDAVMCL